MSEHLERLQHSAGDRFDHRKDENTLKKKRKNPNPKSQNNSNKKIPQIRKATYFTAVPNFQLQLLFYIHPTPWRRRNAESW